ncbi:MAG TPA: hypothetical protein VFI47_10990 [Acidimicrobiales bacterium]|nr:hypothetical protein [Acidimicrobiales bacterium]
MVDDCHPPDGAPRVRVRIFHVVLQRSGPQWNAARPIEEQNGWLDHASFMDVLVESGFVIMGGPLADEHRVVLVVEADSDDTVRATLELDPWHETHLVIDSIDRWTIRLDGGTDGPRRGDS